MQRHSEFSTQGEEVQVRHGDEHQVTNTLLNPQSSFFLLPAEVRNQIYNYIFASHDIHAVDAQFYTNLNSAPADHRYQIDIKPRRGSYNKPKEVATQPPSSVTCRDLVALTQVCRQLHHETASLPYSLNRFCGPPETLHALFCRMDPFSANSVRSVLVNLGSTRHTEGFAGGLVLCLHTKTIVTALRPLKSLDCVFVALHAGSDDWARATIRARLAKCRSPFRVEFVDVCD
ncbi:uncharacterized protein EKO05_0002417 [Ascochyta rabiei]|uniref:uncharacterized protein n=1 Tax=Didymella rabiei TaxID=5454 RepID=UPI002204645D|nr:uncharacterized protein EKO05_0002417 [Ascochyta rabiei]UPX11831.1 hypothetical protein EKO05_0002417 [Ascochyta rabiei]